MYRGDHRSCHQNFSFVKDKRVVGKIMAIYGLKKQLISNYFWGVRRTCMGPPTTSEAITHPV